MTTTYHKVGLQHIELLTYGHAYADTPNYCGWCYTQTHTIYGPLMGRCRSINFQYLIVHIKIEKAIIRGDNNNHTFALCFCSVRYALTYSSHFFRIYAIETFYVVWLMTSNLAYITQPKHTYTYHRHDVLCFGYNHIHQSLYGYISTRMRGVISFWGNMKQTLKSSVCMGRRYVGHADALCRRAWLQ